MILSALVLVVGFAIAVVPLVAWADARAGDNVQALAFVGGFGYVGLMVWTFYMAMVQP